MSGRGAADDRVGVLHAILAEAIRAHELVLRQDARAVLDAVDAVRAAFAAGGKVLAFGNGGSAADSQHIAAELVNRLERERRALPAIALSTDTSVLTSLGNDYGYERVFARQIDAIGRRGDVALGISTSGAARNVLAAFAAARERGLTTIALTGRDGGELGARADIHINVPHASTARVQEVHRTLLHAMCELIERD
jgi:D-sedoheptulose 7-phosphate isomerase